MIRLPHLETNVTAACQNRCIACNHFVPLQVAQFKQSMIDPAQMARDLAIFARLVRVEAYGMLGGEPTLHPALAELVTIAVKSEIAPIVEVWTNGQSLMSMGEKFWRAMHMQRVVMSVYPGKVTDGEIHEIQQVCNHYGIELHVKDERRFPNFTQLLVAKDSGSAETRTRYERCWFKTFSRVLDNGYFYRCCTSPYIPKLLQNKPEGTDGLKVEESLTTERILEFLRQNQPMSSCTICAGRNTPEAKPVVWRELKDPQSWLNASSGRPE